MARTITLPVSTSTHMATYKERPVRFAIRSAA
jgi:hypothetical protein